MKIKWKLYTDLIEQYYNRHAWLYYYYNTVFY